MPLLTIITNVAASKVPAGFVDKIIPVIARGLNKPPQSCVATIIPDRDISFGGNSKDPGAVATLNSIGHLGPQENQVAVKAISDFVEETLGVPSNRFMICFYDHTPWNIGISGSTVQVVKNMK